MVVRPLRWSAVLLALPLVTTSAVGTACTSECDDGYSCVCHAAASSSARRSLSSHSQAQQALSEVGNKKAWRQRMQLLLARKPAARDYYARKYGASYARKYGLRLPDHDPGRRLFGAPASPRQVCTCTLASSPAPPPSSPPSSPPSPLSPSPPPPSPSPPPPSPSPPPPSPSPSPPLPSPPPPSPSPSPPPPHPMACSSSNNIALHRPASASAEYGVSQASNVNDGLTGTRWISGPGQPHWLMIDLQASHHLCRVRVNWEAAYAAEYEFACSTDGSTYTLLTSEGATGRGVKETTIDAPNCRYLRLDMLQRGTNWDYSIWELEVFELVLVA